jgi:hypothetical protein
MDPWWVPIRGLVVIFFSLPATSAIIISSGEEYLWIPVVWTRALRAGLLSGSASSLTACAVTFRVSRTFVASVFASALRIGRATAFQARSIARAPSL